MAAPAQGLGPGTRAGQSLHIHFKWNAPAQALLQQAWSSAQPVQPLQLRGPCQTARQAGFLVMPSANRRDGGGQ